MRSQSPPLHVPRKQDGFGDDGCLFRVISLLPAFRFFGHLGCADGYLDVPGS